MTTAYNCGKGRGGRGPGWTAELFQQTHICGLRSSGTNATVKHLHQSLTQYCLLPCKLPLHSTSLSVQDCSLLLPILGALSLPNTFSISLVFIFIHHTVLARHIFHPSSASNLALCHIREHPRPTAIIDFMLESHYNCMTDYTVTLSSEQPFLITFFHPLLLLSPCESPLGYTFTCNLAPR